MPEEQSMNFPWNKIFKLCLQDCILRSYLPIYPFFVLKSMSSETKITTAITMALQNCRNNWNYGSELSFLLIFICGDNRVATLIIIKISHLFALTFYYLFFILFQSREIRQCHSTVYIIVTTDTVIEIEIALSRLPFFEIYSHDLNLWFLMMCIYIKHLHFKSVRRPI